jgi:hypothetical protein
MKLKFELNQAHISTVLMAFTKGVAISGDDHCVLKFSETPTLRAAFFSSDAPEVWLTFDRVIFSNESILCESARQNLIDMEVPVKGLLEALKFASKMKKTTVKLSRAPPPASDPVLMFEFRYGTGGALGQHFVVYQSIPVVVFRTDAEIREMPQLLDPDVKTEVLGFTRVKQITDRLKHLKFQSIVLRVSDNSTLSFTGTSEAAEMSAEILAEDDDGSAQVAQLHLHTDHLVKLVDAINALPTSGPPIFACKSNQYLCLWAPLSDHIGALTSVTPAMHPYA